MKKVLFKLFLSIAICSFGVAVYAETMQVMSLSDFTTENPSEYIEVQIYNDIQLDEDLSLRSGYQVKGKVVDVVSPKRLKRDAKFSIIPVSYKDFSGVEHPIKKEHVGKYSPKFDIDKGQLAKDAALAVGNHFVKGLSLGYHAVEGAVKNEEGNRLKSSVVSIYESTPLSYANNGEEIVIKKNDFLSEIDLVNKLSEIKPMLHQQSVAAAIETMIIELGLFDVVKKVEDDSALGASCLKTIIDVAKIYEEHSVQMNFPATIDGFIRYVDEVCPKVAGDPAGVQLHTYHSCKGLQWKYVILTDLNNDVTDTGKIIKHDIYGVHFARDNKPTADNPYPKVHIWLAQWIYDRKIPDEIEDKICAMDLFKEAQKSAEEESNRLLYVGMTRPRDVLILEVDKKGEFFKWFKCIGVNGIAPDVSLAEGDLLGTGAKFTNVTLEDKDIAELAGYRYNNDDVRTRTIPIKKKAERPCLPPRYISPSEINEIGNAEEVYNFNQRISFSNQPADMATVGDCIHNVFAICDNALPITPEKVKNIVFNHRLYNVFSDEREIINAWNNLTGYLKQTHGEAVKIYHERPFRLERDGHTIVGSMDLVWQTAEGDILIDFKTCPMGFRAILDKNSSHYAGRYAGQLRAYTEALVAAGETVITRYAYYPVSGLLVKII